MLVSLWGFASGWKVRSREFASPLVVHCAMGVANAVASTLALNFAWLVILWGFASGWDVSSREFTATCWLVSSFVS